MAGFQGTWMLFGTQSQTTAESHTGPNDEPSDWMENAGNSGLVAFCPSLGDSGLRQAIHLSAAGRQGVALGVLTQTLGDMPWLVALIFNSQSP